VVLDGTSTRFAGLRFSGSAAGGQAKAVVDGDGRLVDLAVDALLLRRPPRGIADAILSAVQQAQDEAAAARPTPSTAADVQLDPDRITADVAAVEREADRRISELSAIVSDLIRHQDRRP
jgi:DNA-binding protein YbaB